MILDLQIHLLLVALIQSFHNYDSALMNSQHPLRENGRKKKENNSRGREVLRERVINDDIDNGKLTLSLFFLIR